ncbi:MAG TPA: hypothetical protein VGI16_15805 [Candidatus Acidoferrum sp.]
MFGSQVLEVVVGLTLIYLAMSIACSGIKEVIASAFALRAKTLERTIRNMLQGSSNDYAAKIFGHPLIASSAPEGKKPSYIASRAFASALFDVLAPPNATQPRTIESLRASVALISDVKLRDTLLGLIDSAQCNLDVAREKVEHWFDDTMQRISGWYKRMAQKIIFATGLALCLLANADSLMIVKELWSDQALRSAVVAQAQQRIQIGSAVGSCGSQSSLGCVVKEVREANAPPIGWARNAGDVRNLPREFWGVALKIVGILLTAFAIMLGAPFWFDLLNKLINVRLSGDPPAIAGR